MSNIWERFESVVTKDEVADAKVQFAPLLAGDYRVLLEEIAPSESKDGLPMIKGKFRVIETNRVIFYNQLLQNINYPNLTAQNIAEAVTFISGLLGEDISFEGMGAFAEVIGTVQMGTEYTLSVSYGKKDYECKFPKLKVVEKVVPVMDAEIVDGDVPF